MTEVHLLTCRSCGCDRGHITHVIQTADYLPMLFEFEGRCGHRWTILTEACEGVTTLPAGLSRQLRESYQSLTAAGRETAASISIELFFGDVMMHVIARREIPINQAIVHFIEECCGDFLMDRFCEEEAQAHVLDGEAPQW